MSQVIPETESSSSGTRKVTAARQGDGEARGALLESCRRYLKYIARCELSKGLEVKEDASDIVQLTFVKAESKFDDFAGKDPETLRRWLGGILRNTLKDLVRKYEKAGKRDAKRERRLDASSQIQRKQNLPAADKTPSQILMAQERVEVLDRALECLPEDQRQVVFLRTQKQLKFEEIGRLMNRSGEAARALWTRAIERLATEIRARS